jgi:hypothetical protein
MDKVCLVEDDRACRFDARIASEQRLLSECSLRGVKALFRQLALVNKCESEEFRQQKTRR